MSIIKKILCIILFIICVIPLKGEAMDNNKLEEYLSLDFEEWIKLPEEIQSEVLHRINPQVDNRANKITNQIFKKFREKYENVEGIQKIFCGNHWHAFMISVYVDLESDVFIPPMFAGVGVHLRIKYPERIQEMFSPKENVTFEMFAGDLKEILKEEKLSIETIEKKKIKSIFKVLKSEQWDSRKINNYFAIFSEEVAEFVEKERYSMYTIPSRKLRSFLEELRGKSKKFKLVEAELKKKKLSFDEVTPYDIRPIVKELEDKGMFST